MSRHSISRRAFLGEAGRLTAGLVLLTSPPPAGVVAASGEAATVGRPGTSGNRPRPIALIANSLSDTLTVVDARALEPFATIPVGREPHKFHLSLTGSTVYSCNTTSNEMIEIDPAALRVVRRIPILDPYNVTFTRDGRYLYKVAYRYAFVEIHDARTFRMVRRLETGRQPSHYALSPDGRWFINANQHSNIVSVIDTHSMTVARRLPVDPLPAGVAISHDGQYAFVASGGAGTINIFALDEWKLVQRVRSGKDAHEMVMTGDGTRIFVTNRGENTTSIFDVAARRVMEKFPVPGGPDTPVLSADERYLWLSGRYADTATVVDARTVRILNTFRTGRSPHGIFLGVTGA